jgi:hypothetical protein
MEVTAAVLIGGTTGGAAVMALIAAAVVFVIRRQKTKTEEGPEEAQVTWVNAEESELIVTGETLNLSDIAAYMDERQDELSDLDPLRDSEEDVFV